jgi:hypothetical protein
MPGAMSISVASLTFQFRVDDWPRSMVAGSAVNRTVGFGGGGAGVTTGGGGGGGGGAGTGFLQPVAIRNRDSANSTRLTFRLFILNFAS